MKSLNDIIGKCTHKISLFSKNLRAPKKDAPGKLREPQAEIIPEALRHLLRGDNVLIEMGPGGGKTLIAQIICQELANCKEFGKLTIIATPKLAINYEPKDDHAIYDGKYRLDKCQFEKIVMDGNESKISKLLSVVRSYRGDPDITYCCTHAALARMFKELRALGETHLLDKGFIVLDEGQHSAIEDGGGGEDNSDNLLGSLIRELDEIGGQYMLTTATNFRSDGKALIKDRKRCHFIVRSYYDLLHRYGAPYLSNQSISICFYSYETAKTVNQVFKKSTDKKYVTGNLGALTDSYMDQYERNPIPTLINCPYASLKNGMGAMKNKDIALFIEERFRERFPHLRILNVGGIRKGGESFLVSETSDRHMVYKETEQNPDGYDLVIQIQVMNEGVNWVACRRTFCNGITHNSRLFVQRDVGRGARVKPFDNDHEIVYFIHGVFPEEGSREYGKARANLLKQMVHYESLIVSPGIYTQIVTNIKPLNLGNGHRYKDIPFKLRKEMIEILQERGISGEMDSKTVWNTINNSKLLENYSVEAKIDLFANIEKVGKGVIDKAIDDTNKKAEKKFAFIKMCKSRAFHEWFKLFEETLGGIDIEEVFVKDSREFRTKMTSKKVMEDVEGLLFAHHERILTPERVDELVESVMND